MTQNLEDAFKTLYNQLKAVKRPDKCKNCRLIDYCGNCPARFYSETGDVEKTCDELCQKVYIKYSLSVHHEQSASAEEKLVRSKE